MRARLLICLGLVAIAVGCGQSTARAFQAQVRHARVGSTRIAWYERGQGPPLLMLMGTGSTMGEWDPALLRLLARRHRLILLDYPGLGLSGPWHGRSPAVTTHAQVAAEDPWLRSNRNYRRLAGILAPTLAAAGARDPVVPPLNLRRIAHQVPHSRFARFPGAHAFLFQARGRFTRAVDRFLGD